MALQIQPQSPVALVRPTPPAERVQTIPVIPETRESMAADRARDCVTTVCEDPVTERESARRAGGSDQRGHGGKANRAANAATGASRA
jgi:hypothetical protein